MKDLEDFVPKGATVDSTAAVFTLDPVRARDILARFHVEEPALFLLHFVQAAATQGRAIDFVFGNPTVVSLPDFEIDVAIEALPTSAVLALQEGRDSAERYLFSGLNGCMLQPGVSVSLVLGEQKIDMTSGRCMNLPSAYSGVQVEMTLPKSMQNQARALLRERTAVCPVDVTVDGRLVSGEAGQSQLFASGNESMSELVTRSGGLFSPITYPTLLDGERRQGERDAWVVLWSGANEKTVVRVTRAGVIVDFATLITEVPGFVVTMAGDDLRTDISGFQISTEDLERQLPWIKATCQEVGRTFTERAMQLPTPPSEDISKLAFWPLLTFILMFPGMFMFPTVGLGFPLLFFAALIRAIVIASRRAITPRSRSFKKRAEVHKRLSTRRLTLHSRDEATPKAL